MKRFILTLSFFLSLALNAAAPDYSQPPIIGSADLADSSVTSAKIANDTIVNADVNSAAAIVDTKLATISTAGKVAATALPAALNSAVSILTPGATPALNAALGGTFTLTVTDATANTIAVPANPVDGQTITIVFYANGASGAGLTLALNTTGAGSFRFTTDIPALSVSVVDTIDFIGCKYSALNSRWNVVAYTKGAAE